MMPPPPVSMERPVPPAFTKLDSSQHVSKAVSLARGWPIEAEAPPTGAFAAVPVVAEPAARVDGEAASAAVSSAAARRQGYGQQVKFGTRYNSFESIDENLLAAPPPARFDSTEAPASSPIVLGSVAQSHAACNGQVEDAGPELIRPPFPKRYDSSSHFDKALAQKASRD